MAGEIGFIARLLAYEAGRAMPIASRRHISIQPHARVLCPMVMAGEDTYLHILAFGALGAPPEIRSVPDPRLRDDQYKLVGWLSAEVERYFKECLDQGTFPQLWVSCGAAASLLDLLADRLRYSLGSPEAKRLGELLTYSAERYPHHGQQALLTATGALAQHFATGQQEGENEHLGAFLVWMEPPAGVNTLAAVALAEQNPMGIKTDPDFDKKTLEPLVTAYNQARRRRASSLELTGRAQQIHDALAPAVGKIYENTQRAIQLLEQRTPTSLFALSALEEQEADSFQRFWSLLEKGTHFALRDRPKPAAFKISRREEALEIYEKARLYGDDFARAEGRLAGRILLGIVKNPKKIRLGSRQSAYRFEVLSEQRALHLRVRDELAFMDNPNLQAVVENIHRTGQTTCVSLRLVKGMIKIGLPEEGKEIELGPSAIEWHFLYKRRQQLWKRLERTPWTHEESAAPPVAPRPASRRDVPSDLLAALEALK